VLIFHLDFQAAQKGVGFGRRPFSAVFACISRGDMKRIISMICATTLTLGGAILLYIELAWPHSHFIPGKLIMGSVFMFGVGLLWLAADIGQWRE